MSTEAYEHTALQSTVLNNEQPGTKQVCTGKQKFKFTSVQFFLLHGKLLCVQFSLMTYRRKDGTLPEYIFKISKFS